MFHLFPGGRAGIDKVDMVSSGDVDQVHIFHLQALLFGCDIIAAEGRRNRVVGLSVNQPLLRLDWELHGIGFAVTVRNFARGPVKKFDDRVVAQVKLISSLQVNDSRQRYHCVQCEFVSCKTQCELPSRRMSHDDRWARIDTVPVCVPEQEMIAGANISKRSGPAAAFVPDAPVFQICCCNPFYLQSSAEMSGMSKIVFSAPEAAVNKNHKRYRIVVFCRRKAQVQELVGIGSVRDALVRRGRRQVQNVVRHRR